MAGIWFQIVHRADLIQRSPAIFNGPGLVAAIVFVQQPVVAGKDLPLNFVASKETDISPELHSA